MVSKLGTKGLIQRTERRKKSESLQARKRAKNIDCYWVTGNINKFVDNDIFNE